MQQGLEHIAGFDASTMKFRANTVELYFETEDFGGFMQLLDSYPQVERLHEPKTFSWIQRGIHIISEEIWNKAQEIRESRYRPNENVSDGARTKFTRKYAFSSMCQCGFCGTNLTRRSHHQDTQHKKPVWKCRTAANKGIENCPHSKAIDEVIIENAFLEMFRLLAENFDDVLESVLSSLEAAISKDDSIEKLKRAEKEISTFEKKRKKLTDMYLDDKISKEAYEEKYSELNHKLDKFVGNMRSNHIYWCRTCNHRQNRSAFNRWNMGRSYAVYLESNR